MTVKPLPRPLRGIIPPMVTPLSGQDQLDLEGLQRLVERLIGGGVHGLFALGTTGEAPSLSHHVRRHFVELVCDQVAGRLPVVVGITDTSFTEAVDLAEFAFSSGAAAVVTAAPYYLPMTQAELRSYIEALAKQLPLPLLLYNMPSCTKTAFAPETVRQLADLPNVVGLKDSSGDLEYLRTVVQLLQGMPEFTLLVGPEEMLAQSLAAGAHGGVSGGANMFPQLYVALYEAAVAGKQQEVERLHRVVMRISESIYSVSEAPSRVVKGIKSTLKVLGVCDDYIAQPFRRYEGGDLARIAGFVDQISRLEGTGIAVPAANA